MASRVVLAMTVGLVVCLAGPVWADYYDEFDDGYFDDPNWWPVPGDRTSMYVLPFQGTPQWPDPNAYDPNVVGWDENDPRWQVWAVMFDDDELPAVDVVDGRLNLWLKEWVLLKIGFAGAIVNQPPYDPAVTVKPLMTQDPNDSESFYGTGTDHYILAHMRYEGDPNDPNYADLGDDNDPNYLGNAPKGEAVVGIHIDPAAWEGMFLGVNCNAKTNPYLYMHNAPGGFTWYGPGLSLTPEFNTDPNLPIDMVQDGIWMLLAYDDGDGEDANTARWKSAAWVGDKYDWDGEWLMESRFSDGRPMYTYSQGPNYVGGWPGPGYVLPEAGVFAVCVYGVSDEYPYQETPAWVSFDHVEARVGMFTTQTWTPLLTFYHGENGTVSFDPDNLADPNDDPNDPNAPRTYLDGTEVSLTAEPYPGKIFLKWKVMDANGTSLYEDTNAVTYLTMDQAYQVECQFKCGSSVPPFVAMTLMALAVGVVVRRRLLS